MDAPSFDFLPVNLNLLGRGSVAPDALLLAAVDAPAGPALRELIWKTTDNGTVVRRFFNKRATHAEGREIISSEQLAHRLKGLPPYSPTYFENGDPLDCRLCNIKLAANLSEARDHRKKDEPNLFVSRMPGYAEKLLDIKTRPEFYTAQLQRHRPGRLSRGQVRKILDQVSGAEEGFIKGATAQTVKEYIADEFKVDMHIQQVRIMLLGKSLRVPGYDYGKLKALRPSPQDRAIARWKEHRFGIGAA